MTRRPDLFIIGAAKCGTTSIYEYLKGHPDVFMSVAKEPRYFAADLDNGSGHDLHYPQDEERYLALFEGAGDAKRLGEASVRYIYSHEAPRLIRQFEPNAYIVAMIRNPVDMLYSLHTQRLADGAEDITDFEQALAADEDRRQGRRLRPGQVPQLALYHERALFGQQLQRWFETFGRDRVHVIVFEDFVREPAVVFRRLLEFLEVDPTYVPPSFAAFNPSHLPRSQRLLSLSKSRFPQWVVWQALPRVIGDRSTRALVRGFRHSPINRKGASRAALRPELRRELEDYYAADAAETSEMLGRDLGELWWKRPLLAAASRGSA